MKLDMVLRVGGSSNNEFVKEYLRKKFRQVDSVGTYHGVVSGLAVVAEQMFK